IRDVAADVGEELLLQSLRDRTATAVADRDLVDRADGSDFGRGSSEEDFVGDVQHLARDERLDDFEAEVAGDSENARARNAAEDRGAEGRSEDAAVANDEDVLAGSFADVSVYVERDAFGVPVDRGFLPDSD